MEAVRAPVDFEPLVPIAPDQPPEAVQAVALVEDQLSVVLAPLATILELALMLTLGAACAPLTLTVADWLALPPGPVQFNTYWAAESIGPVDLDPLVGTDPLQEPEAVHAFAFVEFHLSVADCPRLIDFWLGDRVTVGAGVAAALVATVFEVDPLTAWLSPAHPDSAQAESSDAEASSNPRCHLPLIICPLLSIS